MSFVKLLEDVAGMMSMNIHFKCVLDFIGVFDLAFLFIIKIWHDVKKGWWYTLISMFWKKIKYPHSVLTLWICVPIFDAMIPNKLFLVIFFLTLTFPSFLPKMHAFVLLCAVMLPRYIRCHLRKPHKTP